MWLTTTHGFFSAVEHWDDMTSVVVRARDIDDLYHVVEAIDAKWGHKPTVFHTPKNDYPWRITILKTEWAAYVADEAANINYPNFKDAVRERQSKEREGVYHNVWFALQEIERYDRSLRGSGRWLTDRATSEDEGWGDEAALGE